MEFKKLLKIFNHTQFWVLNSQTVKLYKYFSELPTSKQQKQNDKTPNIQKRTNSNSNVCFINALEVLKYLLSQHCQHDKLPQ